MSQPLFLAHLIDDGIRNHYCMHKAVRGSVRLQMMSKHWVRVLAVASLCGRRFIKVLGSRHQDAEQFGMMDFVEIVWMSKNES